MQPAHDTNRDEPILFPLSLKKSASTPDEMAETLEKLEEISALVLGTDRIKLKFEHPSLGPVTRYSTPLSPALTRNTLQRKSDSSSMELSSLCSLIYTIFNSGFKSRVILGKDLRIWDFIEKASTYLSSPLASDPESQLDTIIKYANSQSHWSRELKFEWLIISGISKKILHVWIDMVGLYVFKIE